MIGRENQVDGGLIYFHVVGELSLDDRVSAVLDIAQDTKAGLNTIPPLQRTSH